MKYFPLVVLIYLASFVLVGCSAKAELSLSQDPITVKQSELSQYWVQGSQQFSFSNNLTPPSVDGHVVIKYLIDSKGRVFDPKVEESYPEGAWDRVALLALSNLEYKAADGNAKAVPVYVSTKFNFNGLDN